MRIESIEIHNFRQYQKELFSFDRSKEKDLHIILGKNGVGKTNVLNAITWCLYNKELHLGDQNTATSIINNSFVAELQRLNINKGDVSVKISISTDDAKIIVERKSTYSIGDRPICINTQSKISIFENGDWRVTDDEEMVQIEIHKHIPEEINEYIFFDGEHLEHYFQEGQREKIKNGINELTQASTVNKTIKTFERYIAQEISPRLEASGDKDVEDCQRKVDGLIIDRDNQADAVEKIESSLQTCNQNIKELDDKLRGNESVPEKVEELQALEIKQKELEDQKKSIQGELFKFTRDYFQYFALYPQMKTFYDFIKKQERDGKLPPKIDKNLIVSILGSHHCLICDTDLDEHAEEFVREIQKKLDISSAVSAELNKTMTALNSFFEKLSHYKEEKDKIFKKLQHLEQEIAKAEKKYQELTSYLKSFPNDNEITMAFKRREEYLRTKDDLLEKYGREKAILEGIENNLRSASEALDKAIAKSHGLEDIRAKKNFCNECIRVLEQIEREVLEESRSEMEKETMDIFRKLLWKKDAFQKVTIGQDYVFSLIDNYGRQTLGSCSAAERALLALSFTLALQKTSKHDSLLFIDTPIGRVDEENRDNFIKTLLEIANEKQVILTFTPTEYDSNVRMLLHDQYSSFNEINMNESITTIKKPCARQ